MDKKNDKDAYRQVGDLMDEILEAKKISAGSDKEIFTLTVECSAFFTLVCC